MRKEKPTLISSELRGFYGHGGNPIQLTVDLSGRRLGCRLRTRTSKTLSDRQDTVYDDCINTLLDLQLFDRQLNLHILSHRITYLNFRGIVVQCAVRNANQSRLLDHFHQSWTYDQGFGGGDNTK